MLAILLLGAMTHCADPRLCPTRREFEQAVKAAYDQLEWDLSMGANSDGQSFAQIHLYRPRRISNLHCGGPLAEDPTKVACKATFHFHNGPRVETRILTRGPEGWTVTRRTGVDEER